MNSLDNPERYAQALAAQRQSLARASRRRGERPTDRKSKDELHSLHMMALMEMSSQRGQGGIPMKTTFVPPAYPPCVMPIESLQPIKIRDLQLETHHRGRYLLLRSITPPVRMTGIMAIVVDENDDAVTLQLYQQDHEDVRPAANIINTGFVLVVKEPYFKVFGDGGYGLRVDHRSDAVTLNLDHDLIPKKWRSSTVGESSNSLKAIGNQHMAKRAYWEAIDAYSQALSQPDARDMIDVLKRNRALAYLKTAQYDAALRDTGYPELDCSSPDKALFRAAEALYYLGLFGECLAVTEMILRVNPGNKEASAVFSRTQDRLKEKNSAAFEFPNLQKNAMKLNPPLFDIATYVGPIEVKQTANKGRGMFLTADVKAGDILLCEKAFCYAHMAPNSGISVLMYPETDRVVHGGQADLINAIVRKMYLNPSIARQVRALHHGDYQAVDVVSVDSKAVVDTFLVDKIMTYNTFGCPTSSLGPHKDFVLNEDTAESRDTAWTSCGLWVQASYINHSCLGNATRAFIGDVMIVRAAQDISVGTEITIWYLNPVGSLAEIQSKLSHWGFVCECPLCKDAETTGAAVLRKRQEIVEGLKPLFKSVANKKTRTKIEAAVGLLNGTYARPAEEVPRFAVWDPQMILARAYGAEGNIKKSLYWVGKALQSLGFVTAGIDDTSAPFLVVKWGQVDDYLVPIFLDVKAAFMSLGLQKKSREAEAYARTTYRILVGEDSTFESIYGHT